MWAESTIKSPILRGGFPMYTCGSRIVSCFVGFSPLQILDLKEPFITEIK